MSEKKSNGAAQWERCQFESSMNKNCFCPQGCDARLMLILTSIHIKQFIFTQVQNAYNTVYRGMFCQFSACKERYLNKYVALMQTNKIMQLSQTLVYLHTKILNRKNDIYKIQCQSQIILVLCKDQSSACIDTI